MRRKLNEARLRLNEPSFRVTLPQRQDLDLITSTNKMIAHWKPFGSSLHSLKHALPCTVVLYLLLHFWYMDIEQRHSCRTAHLQKRLIECVEIWINCISVSHAVVLRAQKIAFPRPYPII